MRFRPSSISVLIAIFAVLSACDKSNDPILAGASPTDTVAAPVFSPAAGDYDATQTVALSSATNSAIIHYTTDGHAPTDTSATYTSPLTVSASQTLKAVAVKKGMATSPVITAAYTIAKDTVAAPVFSPSEGIYDGTQIDSISTATPGATIHYTTDGSTPTDASATYASPVTVRSDEKLKAIAVKKGMVTSSVATAIWAILKDTVAAPVFSPSGGYFVEVPTMALSSSTSGASIYYTTDGSVPTVSSIHYSSPVKVDAWYLQAVAVKWGMVKSRVSWSDYHVYPWNDSVQYGSLNYAGQTYKTVTIGSQTWMAENLNIKVDSSWLASDPHSTRESPRTSDIGAVFGRLYDWGAALMGPSPDSCGIARHPSQGICPCGWHLPSDSEWTILSDYVGGESAAGVSLQCCSQRDSINPWDKYGFRILKGGWLFSRNGSIRDFTCRAEFLTTTPPLVRELGTGCGYSDYADNANKWRRTEGNMVSGGSIRCLKD